MKAAVIGVGNMGHKYAVMMYEGQIPGCELSALTRVRGVYKERLAKALEAGIPVYDSADLLFEDVESGSLRLDAVIIATPHYSHEALAKRAFQNRLHVLCEKPSGVYTRQGREMEEAAAASGKTFGMIFHQRTFPVYRKLRKIVQSGMYGKIKRVSWIVSDWYRPDSYYASGSWRATWSKDGGGVLLNQCPHNIDLLQWILGVPARVQAFSHEGRYHPIEVEDDVTMYLEWENGATGTFITSTGEAPGINRLEISLENALIRCENGTLMIGETEPELGMPEPEYRKTSENQFAKIKGTWKEIRCEAEEDPYGIILRNFTEACTGKEECIAPGSEGRKSLMISNAAYLSSWKKRMIELPKINSSEERDFEAMFEVMLEEKANA